MDMQDNELDKLFGAKLESFEVMPSKQVWQGITAELDKDKRKKIALLPFLSIAASIIVLFAAGVLFISHPIKSDKKPIVKDESVKNQQLLNTNPVAKIVVNLPANKLAMASPAVNSVAARPAVRKKKITLPDVKAIAATKRGQPLKQENKPVLAALSQKPDVVVQKTIDSATVSAAAPVIIQHDKPVLAVVISPVTDKPAATPPVKKRRIKSFGDMLNVVIAAVDKRKDKFIEFSDTDDDEATITGVNLGLVKIKKDN